jgi:hypothetical protein
MSSKLRAQEKYGLLEKLRDAITVEEMKQFASYVNRLVELLNERGTVKDRVRRAGDV